MGELNTLMASLSEHGLINPVIVNSKYELLAGYRRLLAAKKLHWKMIEVKIIDVKRKLDKLNIEMEENAGRKDFTQAELDKGLNLKAELQKMDNMPLFFRILYILFKAVKDFFKKIFTWQGDI